MSESGFTQLKSPFSKYEMSDSGTIIRGTKNKNMIGMEKGSIRLTDDNGNRHTIKKTDFETRLVKIDSDVQPVVVEGEIQDVNFEDKNDSSSGENTATPVEEVKEEKNEVKTKEESMKTKVKKLAKVKVAKAKKEKVVKVKKVKAPKQPKAPKEDVLTAEQKAEVKAIVKGEGSKASKMKSIYKVTKSIQATADALETHYSYVYNKLIWYPANPPKAKK